MALPAMTYRYVGRDLTEADLEVIRAICADPAHPTRAAISREACRCLGWTRPDGSLKDMSAKVALAHLAADGLICLPPPTHPRYPPRRYLEVTIEAGPAISCPLRQLGPIGPQWAVQVALCDPQ